MKSNFTTAQDLSDEEREQRLENFKKFVRRIRATGLVTISEISEWQWRFEFAGNRIDLLPVSRKVIDQETLQWFCGRWASSIHLIEKHCESLRAHLPP